MGENENTRECLACNWCKGLEDSEGQMHYFCMDVNGGHFLGETGLLGWCIPDFPEINEEKDFF